MSIDWRNQGGWNWISSVRNQGNTQNCWAFAMTALYEAMVRIEHCVWTRRSEGDLARGTGKQSWDLGNLGEAAIFAERYGLADPDCFAWSEAAALYVAKPHGAQLSALPVSPTPDRAGRTIRVGSTSSLTTRAARIAWLDTVGPLAVMVTLPSTFGAYSSGIYTPPVPQGNGGVHALLIVGYDDDAPTDAGRYWIAKNSWGPRWGENGFIRIAFGSEFLESAGWTGVRGTNPDPWTKRRRRTGALVESGNGARRNNFELFVRNGGSIDHWWREHGAAGFPWNRAGTVASSDPWRGIPADAADSPAVVQSTLNRNFELLYRTTGSDLRHVYFDQASSNWYDAGLVGVTAGEGVPGFVQSTRGAPGDFEAIVITTTGDVQHWTKHNGAPWTRRPGTWYLNGILPKAIRMIAPNIPETVAMRFVGPALVHTRRGVSDELEAGRGELDYVAVGTDRRMYHFRRPAGAAWMVLTSFGSTLGSGPAMIEGQFGMTDELGIGNLELCVATTTGTVEHWWCDGRVAAPTWNRSATFGSGVARVVGFLQGSFGHNLELVVERTDGRTQHYWRDGTGWHAGVIIN